MDLILKYLMAAAFLTTVYLLALGLLWTWPLVSSGLKALWQTLRSGSGRPLFLWLCENPERLRQRKRWLLHTFSHDPLETVEMCRSCSPHPSRFISTEPR